MTVWRILAWVLFFGAVFQTIILLFTFVPVAIGSANYGLNGILGVTIVLVVSWVVAVIALRLTRK